MNKKFMSNSNYVLRKIFRSKENLDILKDFIEAILDIKIIKIKLNSMLPVNSTNIPSNKKFGFASVRVKKDDGKELNIGIQFIDGFYIQTKLLLYYAQVHFNQLIYNSKRKVTRNSDNKYSRF